MQIIDVGTDFASNTLAYVGYLWTDLSTPILMIVGLVVGFFVINKVISLITKRTRA
jgi:hypothetical protein